MAPAGGAEADQRDELRTTRAARRQARRWRQGEGEGRFMMSPWVGRNDCSACGATLELSLTTFPPKSPPESGVRCNVGRRKATLRRLHCCAMTRSRYRPPVTKLYPPSTDSRLLERPDLLATLESLQHRKLAVVTAPTGSGKSTLLAQGFRKLVAAGWEAAWLSLDRFDNEPRVFVLNLVAALAQVRPGFGDQIAGLVQAAGEMPVTEAMAAIVAEFAATAAPRPAAPARQAGGAPAAGHLPRRFPGDRQRRRRRRGRLPDPVQRRRDPLRGRQPAAGAAERRPPQIARRGGRDRLRGTAPGAGRGARIPAPGPPGGAFRRAHRGAHRPDRGLDLRAAARVDRLPAAWRRPVRSRAGATGGGGAGRRRLGGRPRRRQRLRGLPAGGHRRAAAAGDALVPAGHRAARPVLRAAVRCRHRPPGRQRDDRGARAGQPVHHPARPRADLVSLPPPVPELPAAAEALAGAGVACGRRTCARAAGSTRTRCRRRRCAMRWPAAASAARCGCSSRTATPCCAKATSRNCMRGCRRSGARRSPRRRN